MANKLGPIAMGFRGAPSRPPDEVVVEPHKEGALSDGEIEIVKRLARTGTIPLADRENDPSKLSRSLRQDKAARLLSG